MYNEVVSNDGQRFKLDYYVKEVALPTPASTLVIYNSRQDFSILPTGQIHTSDATSRPMSFDELDAWCKKHELRYQPVTFSEARDVLSADGALMMTPFQLLTISENISNSDERLVHNDLVFALDDQGFVNIEFGYYRLAEAKRVAEVYMSEALVWFTKLFGSEDWVRRISSVHRTMMHTEVLSGKTKLVPHKRGERFVHQKIHLNLNGQNEKRNIRYYGRINMRLTSAISENNTYREFYTVTCDTQFIIWTTDDENEIYQLEYCLG
jgi:hypothetical protein